MTLFTLPMRRIVPICLALALVVPVSFHAMNDSSAAAAQHKRRTVGKAPTLPETPPVPQAKPEQNEATDSGSTDLPTGENAAVPQEKPVKEAPQKDSEPTLEEKKETAAKDARIYQNACPALMKGDVKGELIPPLSEGVCGERSPLRISETGKEKPVTFAAPVTTNCAMAGELAAWGIDVQRAAMRHFGSPIKTVSTGSDYQCRKVNGGNQGRVSEHAFANALDIMAFTFKSGETTRLESGWQGSSQERAFWRLVHKISCERFMTVIGPDGDAAHKTNLHLDLGCHGKACQARICQ
ncbi:MAG: extensin family protein [Phyllobacterium sp.]